MKQRWVGIVCLIICFEFIPSQIIPINTKSLLFAQSIESPKVSGSWILGATPFEVTNTSEANKSAASSFATLLPSLILDNLGNSYIRYLQKSETVNRKLFSLRNERKSLISEFSLAVANRDALLFKTSSASTLDKSLKAADEKINEIKKRINENIEQIKKNSTDYEIESSIETNKESTIKEFFRRIFNKNIQTDQEFVYENVVLYKNDSTSLFSYTKNIEDEAVAADIDGLLTGSVSFTEEYCFASVSLVLFPGNEIVFTVNDVTSIEDIPVLIAELADAIIPAIINSNPIKLNVAVSSSHNEQLKLTSIMIDDMLYSANTASAFIRPGIHTVSVEAEGFRSEFITYKFADYSEYNVSFSLQPAQITKIVFEKPFVAQSIWEKITKKEKIPYDDSLISLGAIPYGSPPVTIVVQDDILLGEFITADGISTYFMLPKTDDISISTFSISPNKTDASAYIEKSRRRMYTSYGLLLLSLPFSFYSYSQYVSASNAYALSFGSVSEKEKWRNISYASIGVSVAFGVNLVVQLGRYLYAAKSVLPVTAKEEVPNLTSQ